MKLLFFLIFFCFYGFAEAFGNKIISLPTISIDLINTFSKKDLGIDKQISVGTCLSYALNYDWSFISKTQVGFAPLKNHDSLASSIKTFLGVTYLFGINDLRVFSSLLIGYWQFLGQTAKQLKNISGWPIFVGPRGEIGLEWIFIDEFSAKLLTNYDLYVNISKLITYTFGLELSFNMYF